MVYELVKPEYIFLQMTEDEAVLVIERLEDTHLGNLKYNLQIFKFTNFVFYVLNLYLIIIIFPEFLTKLIVFILDKCLLIIFLYFVAEGYLNFYTDIRLNTVSIVSSFFSYLPMTLINYAFGQAWDLIAFMRNYFQFK